MNRVEEHLLDKFLEHKMQEMERRKREIEDELPIYTKSVALPNMKKRSNGLSEQVLSKQDIACHFCGGRLGEVEKQNHVNPDFAEFRTCLKCGYQWAKHYWRWLAKEQGVILK